MTESGMKGLFYRQAGLGREAVDTEKREAELSFSSEEPVEYWFGSEILLHGQKNINLSRLKTLGSLIYGHQPGDMRNIIGPVKAVWLDDEKRQGQARVGFDEDETGETAMKKIRSGSLRGVSVGYTIDQAQRIYEGETWTDTDSGRAFDGPALIATRWTPYEITLTPVPADATVGVGRSARSLDGIDIKTNNKEGEDMTKEELTAAVMEALRQAGITPARKQDPDNNGDRLTEARVRELVQKIVEGEREPRWKQTVTQARDLATRAETVSAECFREVAWAILDGKSESECLRMITDLGAQRGNPPGQQVPGKDNDGPDNNNQGGTPAYASIHDVPDDVLRRSLK